MDPNKISPKETSELKANLINIKSDFFFQKIFELLERNKYLSIIKYNKAIQNKLKISLKDYKEYSELYSQIEIELKPRSSWFGKYINILDENKEYFHIYFNDEKEEIKRYELEQDEEVNKIKVVIDYQVSVLAYLFLKVECIESISFKKFKRTNITDIRGMFSNCSNLKKIDFSNFITDNVISMSCMFYKCTSLTELDLSNFNTDNVIDMKLMFADCINLKKINILNFTTTKLECTFHMFSDCESLQELIFNDFNINNVPEKGFMFLGCSKEFEKKVMSKINKDINYQLSEVFENNKF